MTPLTLAYSPWWIVVCACALLAIYWDWRRTRQMAVAVLIALMVSSGAVLYAADEDAATVPVHDYCEQFRLDGMPSWELFFLGCW